MKHIFLVLISALLILSCKEFNKGQGKTQASINADSISQFTKSDFRILDSNYVLPVNNHYVITSDTAYFFDQADSLHQRKEYLLIHETVEISTQQNGFALVDNTMSSGKHIIGWMKLSDMQKMLFTAPRIANQ